MTVKVQVQIKPKLSTDVISRKQWKNAYHLARLATCIDPKVNADEQAEAKAYRQLHELIQSGELKRASFRAATKCVDAHRYPHEKLSRYQSLLHQLRHWAIVDGGESNHDY